MDKKKQILEFRKRLDETLASPTLANNESIKSLVKNQLLCSSSCESEGDIGDVIQRRTMEVSNFLELLRSASGSDCETLKTNGMSHKDWKLKQDNDQIRVMYREGPQGTPFHTVLAEGYVEGPIDVCLCVSWESTLYNKWWPQFNIPPFKIIMSTCLQKIGIGEEISLVRVKVPWPVSAREAVLHYFELEYFEDDLIIVLINTVSDTEDINIETHGFSKDGIPEAKDMVRIGLVGGFALQKVTSNKSYFRTIANLDIKLDFVPPALINFVARQLIGSGFKLYQKEVALVANGDENFSKILEGPMYTRIREGLKSNDEVKNLEPLSNKKSAGVVAEHTVEMAQAHVPHIEHKLVSEIKEDATHPIIPLEGTMHFEIQDGLKSYDSDKEREPLGKVESTRSSIGENETAQTHMPVTGQTRVSEIHEGETATTIKLEGSPHMVDFSAHLIAEQSHVSRGSSFISPEVERALGILDKALALVRGHGYSDDDRTESSSDKQKLLNSGIVAKTSLTSSQDDGVALRMGCMNKPSEEANENLVIHDLRRSVADSGADDNRKASTLGNQNNSVLEKTQNGVLSSFPDGVILANVHEAPMPQRMMKEVHIPVVKENGTHENGSIVNGGKEKSKRKNHWLCC